ncbi:MAG: formate dehydrogenase accessory sulfurtransferase FdhD, partial [Candidatus Hermodarchaeota archaeon]
GIKQNIMDSIANEHIIKLFLNEIEILSFATFPLSMDELVIGFLFSEGIISSLDDIISYKYHKKVKEYHINVDKEIISLNLPTLTSGCAKGKTFTKSEDIDPTKDRFINFAIFVKSDELTELMKEFQNKSTLFNETGAVHMAALASTTRIKYYYEDLGRHNAIDKVLGKALLDKTLLEDKLLFTTGRISSEIISKIIIAGLPIVVSRSSPTSYAIDLGSKFGVTVIGFCRGNRFNVYSHSSRII